MQQDTEVVGEEVVVLEYAKNPQVEQQIKHHQLLPIVGFPIDVYPAHVATGGGQGDEQQEAPIPPTVEHVTGNDNQ